MESTRQGGPSFIHNDHSCRICSSPEDKLSIVSFFKSASGFLRIAETEDKPKPLINPSTGGDTWFHGTTADWGESLPNAPESRTEHWNTHLGEHFTSEYGTAHDFATRGPIGGGGGLLNPDNQNARICHVKLHMKNPRYVGDETKLGTEFIEHLANNAHIEKHDPETSYQAKTNLDDLDKHLDGPNLGDVEEPIETHFNRKRLVHDFRNGLESKGYDGIIYENSHEPPEGHECAIAFPNTKMTLDHWEYVSPRHPKNEHYEDAKPFVAAYDQADIDRDQERKKIIQNARLSEKHPNCTICAAEEHRAGLHSSDNPGINCSICGTVDSLSEEDRIKIGQEHSAGEHFNPDAPEKGGIDSPNCLLCQYRNHDIHFAETAQQRNKSYNDCLKKQNDITRAYAEMIVNKKNTGI